MSLFKSCDHFHLLNYHPISLASATCKVLERITASQLIDYINADNLSPSKPGFHSSFSVAGQLLFAYNYVTQNCDVGFPVDVLYLVFKKALDEGRHWLSG